MAPDPRSPLALPLFLLGRLGPLRTLSIAAEVALRVARGEPFRALPPAQGPDSVEDHASRKQAAPAFVLFQVLKARGFSDPLGLVGEIIELAGVRFLAQALGPIRQADLAALDDAGRRRWVETRAAKFPNARPHFEEVSAAGVRFRVTRCRFVTLANAIGEPALASVFCRADERFFGQVEPGVELTRPHTLATGGPDCPFTLRFRPGTP
jgi:hypothetical protein